MTFELLGADNAVTDSGSIEEWWAPEKHRITVSAKGYSFVEVLNDKGLFQTTDGAPIPYAIDLLRMAVVHPIQQDFAVQSSHPEIRSQTISSVPMDCVMLSQKIGVGLTEGREFGAVAPLGLFPTYCLDHGKDTARLIFDLGTEHTVLNHLHLFQGRSTALSISTFNGASTTSTAQVESLGPSTLEDGKYDDVSGLSAADTKPTLIAAKLTQGKLLSIQDAIYPASAKAGRVAGTVIIYATIGRDGRVRGMSLVQVPSPDLAIAAAQAVKQWTYSPYLVNGKATEVQTTIQVNFKLQ